MNSIEPFVVLLDRSGRASWVSRSEAGVRQDELLGTTMWDWTVPTDADLARRSFADCLVHGTPQRFFVTVNAHGRLLRQCVTLERTKSESVPIAVKSHEILPGFESLTGRQREVLRYISLGLSRKQIAAEMGVRHVTIDAHCAAMCSRLNLSGSAELAVFALLHAHDL